MSAERPAANGWESRYRALEEAAVALRDERDAERMRAAQNETRYLKERERADAILAERDALRVDLDIVRDYFKNTWQIDKIIERGRERNAKP